MAVIKLTEIPSFENNFKNALTNRVNSLGLTQIYYDNHYIPILAVSDKKDTSLFLFNEDGSLYGTSSNKEIKDIQSFKDLNIQTIEGKKDYSPKLAWIDTSCDKDIYVVDTKFNSKDNTQHVVRYNHPQYDPSNPKKKNPCTLDDVIIQIDNKKIMCLAISESRQYDPNYGGYPLTFFAYNNKGEILEFDTTDYRNKLFANPKSLTWQKTNLNKKGGFVRLTENFPFGGGIEELIYAFGMDTAQNSFCLELVNAAHLQTSHHKHSHSSIKQTPNKVELDFGSHIDFNLKTLPKFDSASCLDDKEFLIAMVPVVNGNLDNSCRDIYWLRLTGSRDKAVSLADPYRLTNIDRFDNAMNKESPVGIRHLKQPSTSEDMIYAITGQNIIKKFKIDIHP